MVIDVPETVPETAVPSAYKLLIITLLTAVPEVLMFQVIGKLPETEHDSVPVNVPRNFERI